MAIEGILSNPNVEVLNKLIEATVVKQELNAQNLANMMVPGAREGVLSADFQAQFNALLEVGDYEGIKNLEVTTESSNSPISQEKVMRKTKENVVANQLLNHILTTNFKQIETAISGTTM